MKEKKYIENKKEFDEVFQLDIIENHKSATFIDDVIETHYLFNDTFVWARNVVSSTNSRVKELTDKQAMIKGWNLFKKCNVMRIGMITYFLK